MKQIKHDADVPSTVAQYERKHDAVPSRVAVCFYYQALEIIH